MDCRSVLEKLEMVRPGSADLDEPELAEAVAHLAEHPECAARFAKQQKCDRLTAEAMQDVAIPSDLKERLLAELNSESALITEEQIADESSASSEMVVPLAETEAAPQRRRISRRTWLTAVVTASVAVLVVTGVMVWLSQPNETTKYTMREIRGLPVEQDWPAFAGSFEPDLPAGWRYSDLEIGSPGGYSTSSTGEHIAAIYPIQLPRRRRPAVTGYLVVLPKSRIQDPPTARYFATGGTVYQQPFATVSWASDEWVYVCFVRGSGDAVDHLQRALEREAI